MGCEENERQNHPVVPGFVQDSSSPSFGSAQPAVITSEKNPQERARPVASVDCIHRKGSVMHALPSSVHHDTRQIISHRQLLESL